MRKPLRPCKKPGCRALTEETYCPDHRPKMIRVESADWHSWYTDPRYGWPKRRADQLAREPFCRECAAKGLRVRATDADHVVPHRGDLQLFLHGELQSLCHSCHSRKTMQERQEREREKSRDRR